MFLTFFIFVFSTFAYADDIGDSDVSEYDIFSVSSEATDIPLINARHSIVFDRNSKQVLYGKKENEICKMASTTKIMTCLVALEKCNLNDEIIISKKAAGTGGSRLGLSVGDKITVHNLLYGLMLKSGNDAAVAIAEHVSGNIEGFAVLMNEKAKEIGLKSTHFVTPHGLDNDDHFTTAFDLAILTDYALKNENFAKIVNTKTYTIIQNGYPKTLNNTNELLGYLDGVYGVKTGFTNGANRCLVTSCRRDDLDVICIVLGCDTKKDRTQDSIKLLNYIFNNFTMVNVREIVIKDFEQWKSSHGNSFYINKGISQKLDFDLDFNDINFSSIAIDKSKIDKISTDISFISYYNAPLYQNSKVGTIYLKVDEKNYTIDILNTNTIPKKNWLFYITFFFKKYITFFKL